MTRARLRARLLALEARQDAAQPEPLCIWWADVGAGLWREGVGPEEEGGGPDTGRTLPMTPEEAEEARASGGHVVMLTGLPKRGRA